VHTPVIVLLADGLRPDTLRQAIDSGELPAMAALREAGALCEVTSVFPSVTGPAYVPFLLGRFPGGAGIPGLRWFDRARDATGFPDHTRSYVGYQMNALNRDLDAEAPTIFDLVPESAAALSMISRGLLPHGQLAVLNLRSAARAIRTHFGGKLDEWLVVDRETSEKVIRRARRRDTRFVFAAFLATDKLSHAHGQQASVVTPALRIVDDTVAELRQPGNGAAIPRIWIASDHGHSSVRHHDDLHSLIAALGHRVIAHPWVYKRNPDVAVMVSGNAMAHVYLELAHRLRPYWTALAHRWRSFMEMLLVRESVDLLLLPLDAHTCIVKSRARGEALISTSDSRFSYQRQDGDPLGLGRDLDAVDRVVAWEATSHTDYPDGIVQIGSIAGGSRCGDIVLSATRGWDFRERYEPIPHASSHGALHRDHMTVPLLLDRPPSRPPRRTADVMPSALAALRVAAPPGLDGESFL